MDEVEMLLAEGKQYARFVTLLELAEEVAVALGEDEVSHELTLMVLAGYTKLGRLDKEVQGRLKG